MVLPLRSMGSSLAEASLRGGEAVVDDIENVGVVEVEKLGNVRSLRVLDEQPEVFGSGGCVLFSVEKFSSRFLDILASDGLLQLGFEHVVILRLVTGCHCQTNLVQLFIFKLWLHVFHS